MKPLPATPTNIAFAKRIIWFEPPEQALAKPARFLAYAFRYADFSDIEIIHQNFSHDDLREALVNPPPGIIDARSWAYWHAILGQSPPPPMPTRTFA